MTTPQTLFALAGLAPAPVALSQGALVLIDIQNEYFAGPLLLTGVEAAAAQAAGVLARARQAGAPVIHVRHRGQAGGPFDPEAPRGRIADIVAPLPGERVIDKAAPNAFAGTDLLEALGGRTPVLVGFMTHMCVSATARAALDLGLLPTIVTDAVATRDLPGIDGAVVPAATLHAVELAALADRFAVLTTAADLPD